MLKTRVLTALALGAAFLAALLLLPPAGWALGAAAGLAIAAWEWAGFARLDRVSRGAYALATAAAMLVLASRFGLTDGAPGALGLFPVYGAALAFWLIAAPIWLRRLPPHPPAALVLGVGWIVLLPMFLALVHLRNVHPLTLVLTMGIVWVADIAAYFAGRRFGRHRLAPRVSPGKSWEGVAGALLATAAYALLWLALASPQVPAVIRDLPGPAVVMVVVVLALACLSVVGDLFESALKRQAGLKDSGKILPGHGGLLDRIDALTPVLPAAALIAMI